MFKHVVRKLTLVTTLVVLSVSAAYATDTSSTPPVPPTADSVTGTDPVPISPKVIDMILTLLYLA
jgi:hypothetical protein